MLFYRLASAAGSVSGGNTILAALGAAGISSTAAQLIVDAGDAASYGGTGQVLTDRSQGTYPFYFGTTATVAGDDPVFVGTAGGNSANEYFRFDSSAMFRQQSTVDDFNTEVADALHRAGGAWSVIAGVMPVIGAGQCGICGNNGNAATDIGMSFYLTSDRTLHAIVSNGSGTAAMSKIADAALSADAPHMVGVSVNGAGTGFMWADSSYMQVGAADTFGSTYLNASTTSATYTFEIGAAGNGLAPFTSTGRMYFALVFDSALTKGQMDSFFGVTRSKYGI